MRHDISSNRTRLLGTAALFAAVITLTTAYLLHIPVPTGYVHLGDAFVYLAASLLPAPYAVAAAAIGAGLADLLTYPAWMPATLVIKAVVALFFTARGETLLCRRNVAALFAAAVFSPAAYGAANAVMMGTPLGFWPQFVPTFIQAAANGVVYAVLARALDTVGLKARLLSR